MRHTLSLIITALCMSTVAYCQNTISGKITDYNDRAVHHANVILLAADSTFVNGAETGENGEFIIENTDGKGMILRVTCLGYEEVTENAGGRNNIAVRLPEKSEMLGEVVVRNKEKPYKLEGNKLVTSIMGTPLDKLGRLDKILNFIPGIISSGNGITVFGKGTPQFYINGKKVRNQAEIDRIDVKDIKAIELIKNPGAMYSGTTRAVINIKTVRKPGEGLSIYNSNWLQLAHKVSAQELLNINYRAGKLDIFGAANLSYRYAFQDTESSYGIQSANPLKLSNKYKTFSPTKFAEGFIGFDYYPTPYNSFGVRYSHRYRDTDGRIDDITEAYTNGLLTDRQKNRQEYSIPRNHDMIGAYYDGWIKKTVRIRMNAEYYSGRAKDNTQTTENSEQEGTRTVTTRNRSDNKVFASDMVLTYPWKGKHWLSVGAEYYHTDRNYSFFNEEGVLDNVVSKTDQDIAAAYVSYSLQLKKLSLDLGLRYEHYRFNVYNNGILSNEQSKIYNDLYPSISVSYPFGKLKTNLSYSIKTEKPSYSSLNSNVQYDSKNVYNGGNPLLQPVKTHDLQLLMQYGIATLTLDYIHQKNLIIRSYSFYDENVPILLKSYSNHPSMDSFQAFLTLQKSIGIWNPSLSMGLIVDNFKAYDDGKPKKLNNPHATFILNNIFTLPHDWNIYAETFFTTEGDKAEYRHRNRSRVSITVSKSWKNTEFSVLFNDIFKTLKYEETASSKICTDWTRARYDTFNIQVSLSIRLNSFSSKYRGRSVTNKETMRMD